MKNSNAKKINNFIKENGDQSDIEFKYKGNVLRIVISQSNLELWKETYQSHKQPCNILLACEHDKCILKETNLTWVVGSSIRAEFIQGLDKTIDTLKSLGVNNELAILIEERCPGLGAEIPWAFYLERHGKLSASPIV